MAQPTSRRCWLVFGGFYLLASPVVTVIFYMAAVALSGQALDETQGSAAPLSYLALLIPVAWAATAYATACSSDRRIRVLVGVVIGVWTAFGLPVVVISAGNAV